jgi:cyclophilin family peptidyl-prolyl cis-trans isomerase/HEAT repeat protein
VRLGGPTAALGSETIEGLRGVVLSRRTSHTVESRVSAMSALIAARGVDAETVRAAAGDLSSWELRRLAALSLGGSASPAIASERTELLKGLLADSSGNVRVEAVRSWARRETAESGCQRLHDALKDPSLPVALTAIDALGDQCRDDVNVTDRLTAEARTPSANEWHRESHAIVALAKRAPARVLIPLLGSHVSHPRWQVRMYAARAAAAIDEVSALERLALDPNDNVREATLAALRRLKGQDAEPFFISALRRRDYQLLRAAAIESKGMTPTPALADALLDAVQRVTAERRDTSRDTRLALLDRLGELGGSDQAGALVPLLQDFDVPVAQLAASVIQRWTGKPQEIAPVPLPRPALPLPGELDEARTEPARVTLASGALLIVTLRPDVAPLACVRFLRLVKAGYYNGLTFHRVVPNFIVQGGSPDANEYSGDGPYMKDEISAAPHTRGAIGVSTRGPDTGDAQFFINLVDNPRLDFEYTVFGYVTGPFDTIVEGDTIASITFEKEGKNKQAAESTGAKGGTGAVRQTVPANDSRYITKDSHLVSPPSPTSCFNCFSPIAGSPDAMLWRSDDGGVVPFRAIRGGRRILPADPRRRRDPAVAEDHRSPALSRRAAIGARPKG